MRAYSPGKTDGTARIGICFRGKIATQTDTYENVYISYPEKIAKAKDLLILILFCFWGIVLTRV